ncbi:MAG TPA: hypothetical protein VGA61_07330 [Anaerolineae bacterium]
MASLLEKVQILLSADLNRMVDRALQTNETAVFQHHIRELQSLQTDLGDQLAGLSGDVSEMRRRSDEQQTQAVKQDQEVDALLRMGLQEDAIAAQDRLNATRSLAARLTEQVDRLEAEYKQLAETKTRLDARVTALIEHEPEVSGLVQAARARRIEDAANARLDDLAAGPEVHDADVQRTASSIRSRLAAAEAQIQQLEQRGLAHGETPEVLKRKELEDQLEARKARLGLAAPPPAAEPPATGPSSQDPS